MSNPDNKSIYPLKPLPLGIQNFESLIMDGFLYVDKTRLMFDMVKRGRHYFLARPRRFGKSLYLSTLKAYFEGKKHLFEGLAIASLEKEWEHYPIFHIDLSPENYKCIYDLEARLNLYLSGWEKIYGADSAEVSLSARFEGVIKRAATKEGKRIVILVDEYDKPLLSALENNLLQDDYRSLLKAFYGVIKSCDEHIRFSLLTGVTKFSKVSIFSDLNNLNDISRDRTYADVCGINYRELDQYFHNYIVQFAKANKESELHTLARFKELYDGYRFSSDLTKAVYNPFSVISSLVKHEYGSYWFETGTPSYIINILKEADFELDHLTGKEISLSSMDSKDSGHDAML